MSRQSVIRSPQSLNLDEEEVELLRQILLEIKSLSARKGSEPSSAQQGLPAMLAGLLQGELPELGSIMPALLDAGAEALPSLLALL